MARALHSLLIIAVFVVVFLAIHPFQDDNGRLSRVLTTLLLLRAGYAYVPYCSLERVIEQSEDAYYLALRRTRGEIRADKPDWQPWAACFLTALTALKQQKDRLENRIEREQILELCRKRKSHRLSRAADLESAWVYSKCLARLVF